MAASCCSTSSARLMASSSCRARTKRTLSINHHPLALNAAARIESQSPFLWAKPTSSRSKIRRVALGRFQPIMSFPVATQSCADISLSSTSATMYWLDYLRRRTKDCTEDPDPSRGKISAIVAYTLFFLASAASAATSGQTSSSPNPSAKFNSGGNGGGGMGPGKTTQPVFVLSRQKAEDEVREVEEEARNHPYLVSEGIFQGARWTMEDTYKVENGGRFVAVFDGHGGAEVSSILQDRLYDLYSEELAKKHWEQQNEFGVQRRKIPSKSSHIAAIQRGLEQIEDAVLKLDELVYQGSTAVCVILHKAQNGKRTLLSANIGDSRAILCRGNQAVDMTRDHKPSDEQESKRILAMGDEIEWDPYGQVYRVRDLSLSRAVGDRFAKPVVSSEPEIMTFPIVEGQDEFALLASDGLWDVMTSQEVVDFVHDVLRTTDGASLKDKRKNMAKIIANEALERGSADNVCVVLLWLDN